VESGQDTLHTFGHFPFLENSEICSKKPFAIMARLLRKEGAVIGHVGCSGCTIKIGGHMAEKKKATSESTETEKATSSAFDCLAVTQVSVWPFKEGVNYGHVKGMAQIVLNDQIVIRGLRITEGSNGMFIGYPIDAFYKGEDFRNICNPITRQLREHIENCVLEKYHASVAAAG
jgi:stage V sporulation protein G